MADFKWTVKPKKRIAGRTYILAHKFRTREDAQEYANRLRNRVARCRVVNLKKEKKWAVYYIQK